MRESSVSNLCARSIPKRMIDVGLAALALVVLAPVMAVVALVIRLVMGQPVLFRQVRGGYQGRPFLIYKFRTMRAANGPDGEPLPDRERITPLGRVLRMTSLDELPQLWNVLGGELSLVGPRPLAACDLPLDSPEQARRSEVRPGITGWAQIHGRNGIGGDEKFRLDVWYVDHWSLGLDFRILAATVFKVILREGIDGEARASFRGAVARDAGSKP